MLKEKFSKIKLVLMPCKENNYRPYVLESNFLFYYFLFLFILRIVVLPFYIYLPKNVFFAQVVASTLINLTNQERESLGLSSLIENPQLKKAAFLKAQDMLEHDYFGHKSPKDVSGWDWIKEAEYNYARAGENLAIGFLDSEEVHKAWNDSPLHQKNLLNPDFQDIGVAVLKGDFQGNEITVAVQYFGSLKVTESLKEEIIPPIEAAELEIPEEREELEKGDTGDKGEKIVEGAEQAPIFEEEIKREDHAFQFNFLEFMTTKYNQIVEKIVFYSLVLITIVLIFEAFIFINLSFQKEWTFKLYKGSILRTFFFIGFFILLIFFNKQVALYLIPHTLRIHGL